jgi:twitching motility protein PilT
MKTLEQDLAHLYLQGKIDFDTAMSKTSRPEELQRLLGNVTGPSPAAAAQQQRPPAVAARR